MRYKKGFTLVEIMVASVIMVIMIGGIYAVLRVADEAWDSNSGIVYLQQEARKAIDGMVKEIRQTANIDIALANPADITIRVPVVLSPLTLSQDIRYLLAGNQIIREHPVSVPPGTGPTRVVANHVNNLVFTCMDNGVPAACGNADTVRIGIGVTRTVDQRVYNFGLTEEVELRN